MNNMAYMPVIRPVTPSPRQTSPVSSPAAPISAPFTRGSNALFLSPDGDRAEISGAAKFLSMLNQNQRPAIPGIGDPQQTFIPEDGALKALETQGVCHTCENRRYVDQSDDASVSFQTPTKINPNMAAAAVASHEQEHVRNEQARAHREDREIVNQTVTLTYDTCPECGKQYVSGGLTKTTSISKPDSEDDNNNDLTNAGNQE